LARVGAVSAADVHKAAGAATQAQRQWEATTYDRRAEGSRHAGVFTGIEQHVYIKAAMVANKLEIGADCLVTIGGGSATGFAKAVAGECGAPIGAIPTTYAGAEVTSVYGITSEGQKRTKRDVRARAHGGDLRPDPDHVAVAGDYRPSGMNALPHCVRPPTAREPTPGTVVADEGVRVLARRRVADESER
jgi:maleylacetate reductase